MLIENIGISYWTWIGTLYLIYLTYQDHKHNKNVDDRKNYFMMGITFSLISHIPRPIWYLLLLLVITITVMYFMKKIKVLGEADINTTTWIYYGFDLINPSSLVTYFLIFSIVSIAYYVIKINVFKYTKPTPFYIVILICYFLSNFLMELY